MNRGIRKTTAERQHQLATEALRILANRGESALTAKNLGQAVGITDGAVFKHFKTKAAIIAAAIEMFKAVLQIPPMPPSTPPLERLHAFFVTRLGQVTNQPEIIELAFSRNLETAAGSAGAATVRRIMADSISFMRRCIREAQESGEVVNEVTPELLTWMVQGAIQAAAQKRIGKLSAEQVWNQVRTVLTGTVTP